MYVKLITSNYGTGRFIKWESEIFKVSKMRKTYSEDKKSILLEFWDTQGDNHFVTVTPEAIDDIMGYSIDDMLACPDNIYTAVTICNSIDGVEVKSGIRDDNEFFEIPAGQSNT